MSGVPQPENSSQTSSVSWAKKDVGQMDDFDSVVLPPKTWKPDLVYSNLAGCISYDMFSQPFFLLILPDSSIEMFES